jgi:hypothetical protein
MTTRRRRTTAAPQPASPIHEEMVEIAEEREKEEIAEFIEVMSTEVFEMIDKAEETETFVVLPPAPPTGFVQEAAKPLPRFLARDSRNTRYRRG